MASIFDLFAGFEEIGSSWVAARFLVDVAAIFSRQRVIYASRKTVRTDLEAKQILPPSSRILLWK
jgi:hypothetical protein